MLSGGVIMAVIFYWLTGILLKQFSYSNRYIQFAVAGLVVIGSLYMGRVVSVSIKIDTKTGFIEAKNNEFTYSGHAHEPDLFMVLEKETTTPNGRTFKDYKLTIKDDETVFDVPLELEDVREAINNVQKAKDAVPINK